jgi:integrase/recombinase XerD
MNRAIFRLSCCCGLRVSEIGALRLGDVRNGTERPHLQVRAEGAKGRRSRRVPLWWDAGTLADLRAWKAERETHGAGQDDRLIACLKAGNTGTPLGRHTIRRRFRTACRCLGIERLDTLTIHHGRHTFISHALAGGRTLAEVRDAAGHRNLATTSLYLHVAVEGEAVGILFAF